MKVTRREFLRLAGAFTASACIVSPAIGEVETGRIPILLYNDVSDFFNDSHTVSPSIFAAQLEWLYNNGFRVIPLRKISNPPAGVRLAVITFDYGYASFMDYAFPLLKEYGFCATVNVVGGLVGKYIREGRNSRPLLSWDEYRHLLKSGLVDIGCQTNALHLLKDKGVSNVSQEVLRHDLMTFNKTLQKETRTSTDILAWPHGFYGAQSIDVAKNEGFRYLQTTNKAVFNKSGNLLEIPRKTINNRHNLVAFRTEVAS